MALVGVFALLLLTATMTCLAQETDRFYAGKQISLIVGSGAGGNDLYARQLAEFMSRHIPGNPTIVVQNMPGSEGVNAASYIYTVAAKDGTIIGTSPAGILLAEALKPNDTHFQSRLFGWIGTIATTTDLLAVFKSTGVKSLSDAKQRDIVIGATGEFSLAAMEPAIANKLLGTRFRIVKGYTGVGDELTLAMERHEIEGRTNQWASWKVLRPDWIREGLLSYLLQYGPKDPSIPGDVPTIEELVTTPQSKTIVDLLELPQFMGRSMFSPPGVPAERLDVLRKAFDATMQDPAYISRMNSLNLELSPKKATFIQDILARSFINRVATVGAMKKLLDLE